jgi:acetyltransferase-like isoleucine patch superfamily enzyme
MLLLNALALAHLSLIAATALGPWLPLPWRLPAVLAVLYLLPPLAARIVKAATGLREGRIAPGTGAFFAWWAISNLQVLFTRLPFLEELLRVVPGLYGLWLRAWGSRVSSLVYWAPGLQILDRGYVAIGDMVVFGAGVRLNPHVFLKNSAGDMELVLATITIGNGCLVGGYSLLTAGTEFPDGEIGKARLLSPPYSRWKDGVRIFRMGDSA